MSQKSLKLKIRKKWRNDHKAIGASLERLMIFYGRKSNKLLESPDGGFLTAPRPQDQRYFYYCQGMSEGLNIAWKLIFGFSSEQDLKQ